MKSTICILSFLLYFSFLGFTQVCPQVNVGPDISICSGEARQINAYHPSYTLNDYSWTPLAGLGNSATANPIASPSVTTTYTVTASNYGPNLVVNGDFSQGNTGFTSGYHHSNNSQPCNYFVSPDFFLDPNPVFVDHSLTGDNMFMSVNGCDTDLLLWAQSIVVEPNTNYRFKFWASRAEISQPIFKIVFVGNNTGTQTFAAQHGAPSYSTAPVIWDEHGVLLWNSGSNITLKIQLYNLETASHGNDFGLDDISFRKVCTSTNTVTVTVKPHVVLDLGPDVGLCTPSTVHLDAGANFTSYHWSNGGTGQYLDATAAGTYWVSVTGTCNMAVQTDSVTVFMLPLPSLDLGADTTICPGAVFYFSPGAFSSYQWTGSGLSCSNCANPAAVPLTSGVYELTVTNIEGCMATDNMQINTFLPLVEFELGNDIHICAGDDVQLGSLTVLDNYLWSPATGMSCTTCPNPVVSPAVPTTYVLASEDSLGCTVTDSLFVDVFPLPALDMGSDVTICKGDHARFTHAPSSLFTAFHWTPSSNLSCADCVSPEAYPEDTTIYIIEATTSHGCTAVDSVVVFVRDDLPQNVTPVVTDASCELKGTVAVEAVGNGIDELQYNFDLRGFSTNPLYEAVPPGNHLLSVRNGESGCPYYTVVIVGGEEGAVFIPNAFTPDGNETNNTWFIRGTCIAEMNCSIYNRWGEQVAALIDPSQEWDGTYNGQIVPDGIYSYKVEVTYGSHYKEALTGFIAVLH